MFLMIPIFTTKPFWRYLFTHQASFRFGKRMFEDLIFINANGFDTSQHPDDLVFVYAFAMPNYMFQPGILTIPYSSVDTCSWNLHHQKVWAL